MLDTRPLTDLCVSLRLNAKSAYGAMRGCFNFFPLALLLISIFTAPARADGAQPVILALGDSLTAGYGLSKADSFPEQLSRALAAAGTPARVINAGVSGDTSAGGLSRLDWLMVDKPDLVLVELGANDGLRALNPEDTRRNLSAIIEGAKKHNARVLLTGMRALPNLGREYESEFNAIFPSLAQEHGVAFYPFFLDGVAAELDLNQPDGIHPNAEGVSIIVERILPHVRKALTMGGAS